MIRLTVLKKGAWTRRCLSTFVTKPRETPICRVAYFDTKKYDIDFFDKQAHKFGLEVKYFDFRLTETTANAATECDTVCVFVNDQLTQETLQILQSNGVRHVALRCAGFNNIDLDAAKQSNLFVTRVPSYSPHAVAEHTISLLLTLNRKIHRSYNRVREFNFSLSGLVGMDIHQKYVGIIGTGKIGKLTAQIFRGFGAHVLVYDQYPDLEWAEAHKCTYVSLDEALSQSHIVSLHVPLTPDTHHLIGGREIELMRKGVLLVNTSRGKLISTSALIHGLKRGHLGGVALDVYEEESGVFFEDLSLDVMQDDLLARLLTFPNVLITAHQAFLTNEALTEIARVTAANISAIAQGLPPLASTSLVE